MEDKQTLTQMAERMTTLLEEIKVLVTPKKRVAKRKVAAKKKATKRK